MEKMKVKKIVVLLIGIAILSFGITLFIKATLGADPFTTFNLGISKIIEIPFSITQVSINILILLIVLFIDKKYIGIGTLIAMVLVGPLIEVYLTGINIILPGTYSLPIKICILLIGCIMVSLGGGIYISVNMGAGPYDIIPLLIEEKRNISFKTTRILLDLICVILGSILGETVGIGTLIGAFCLGPAIEFFRKVSLKYLIK